METNDLIAKIHAEHATWQHRIVDIKNELKLLNSHLSDFVSRFTPRQVPPHAEHFQNQFIIQKEQAEILSHDVKTTQESLESFAKNNQTAIDHKYFDSSAEMHLKMADRVETYKKIYNELKSDFRVFLSKYM